eukprot:6164-Karenia_brevis.AAC.1
MYVDSDVRIFNAMLDNLHLHPDAPWIASACEACGCHNAGCIYGREREILTQLFKKLSVMLRRRPLC